MKPQARGCGSASAQSTPDPCLALCGRWRRPRRRRGLLVIETLRVARGTWIGTPPYQKGKAEREAEREAVARPALHLAVQAAEDEGMGELGPRLISRRVSGCQLIAPPGLLTYWRHCRPVPRKPPCRSSSTQTF